MDGGLWGEEGWPACGGLWRAVAACGDRVLPLDDAIKQAAFCSIGRFQSAEWEIARSCSNG